MTNITWWLTAYRDQPTSVFAPAKKEMRSKIVSLEVQYPLFSNIVSL